MKDKKNLLHDSKVQALIVALVAVVFLVLVFFAKDNMILLALWISLCLSAFIISAWLLASGLRDSATHYNYFLYDRDAKKALTEKDLTFALVNDTLSLYLSDYTATPVSLWDEIPVSLQKQLQEAEYFRAPVAFRMLYELSLLPADEIVRYFGEADDRIVAYICRNVKAAGDEEMADYIFRMKRNFEDEQPHIANFFIRNKRCFEGRILNYVKRNLHCYIMKK